MCGFAGVIAWDDRYRVSRETLGRMSASIAHRGLDGEGYHINHEDEVTAERPQVALAFRRLAILDPDPRSNQPFTDGRHWLVFNGEIYNFRELREELKSLDPSYEWRTSGDTEVLLRAYAVWGEKSVTHLNGMYAFAIWNEPEREIFLARDLMGQKPLFYAYEPSYDALAFASELGALLHVSWVDRASDPSAMADYLRYGYVPDSRTIYRGIKELAPGSWTFLRKQPWECISGSNTVPGYRGAVGAAEARGIVVQAVQRQLVSDVPLGCFLSGGMDSSIIAAAMKAAVPPDQPVLTFSAAFDDSRYDETTYAAAVAQHLGTAHHRFSVRPDAAADLPKLAAVFGQPFGDSSALPTYYLSRETRQHVKVTLSGDGGDEMFGGYDRYRALALSERIGRVAALARTSRALARLVPGVHPKSGGQRLKRFLKTLHLPPGQRYESYVRLFDEMTLQQMLRLPTEETSEGWATSSLAEQFASAMEQYAAYGHHGEPVVVALNVDRRSYLPGDLLAKVDRASMLHALEVRSPFLDPDVVGFAAALDTDQLLKGGPKRMLREAFAADLPDFVFKRKKMGFAVPIGEWFRGELRPMLRDHLFAADSFAKQHFRMPVVERLIDEHEQFRVDHSQRLYALLMLELWWKIQRE